MRRQNIRNANRRATIAWRLLIVFVGGLLSAQSVFASSTFRTERTSIIDVAGDEFCEQLMGDALWVEAELSEATFVRFERDPNQPGFFDDEYAEIYHLRLQVKRRLFGRDRLPSTIDLPEFETGDPGFYADNFPRPPQAGDLVFANVERSHDGEWICHYIGIPTKAERRRIDRVKAIFEQANSWAAAESLLAGCGDHDPEFAVWCINALSRQAHFSLEPNGAAYGRFREKIDVADFRRRLLDALDDPGLPSDAYVHASDELAEFDLTEAETQQFHQANLQRIRYGAEELGNAERHRTRELLGAVFDSFYANETVARRRDVAQILGRLAASRDESRRELAFQWADRLCKDENDPLNAEIFRIYRDNPPLRAEDYPLAYYYWWGLSRCMKLQTQRTRQVADEGLDLFEQKLPSADQFDLQAMLDPLQFYVAACEDCDVDRNWLHARLRILRDLTATDEQREALNGLLQRLEIPLSEDLRT